MYGLRVDGRLPDKIHLQGGFPAILNPEKVLEITQSRLQRDQEYNLGRLGLGATSTYARLCQESVGRSNVSATRCIYGLYGQAIDLHRVNTTLFGEDTDRAYEKEYLLLGNVPLSHILFATTPEHRQAFEQGLLVENKMMAYNMQLPADLTKSDINDVPSVLRWLLAHDAIHIASKLCKFLFKDTDKPTISQKLKGDETLIREVDRLLSIKTKSESVGEPERLEDHKKLGI